MHVLRVEEEWSLFPDVRIVRSAHPGDNPVRSARSVEQRFMPEMLEDIDRKKRGVARVHIPRNGTQRFRPQAEHNLGLLICA